MRSKKPRRSHRQFLTAAALSAAAIALFFAPREITAKIRAAVRDAALPGYQGVAILRAHAEGLYTRLHPAGVHDPKLDELRAELDRRQLECQQLKVAVAMANDRLAAALREGTSAYAAKPATPLFVPELLEANVFADDVALRFRSSQLVDRGGAAGVAESDLILQSTAPLVDQGADRGIAADQPVYAGRTVIGKIRDAGRSTSTITRVTDEEFRGHAQLAWSSPEGPVFGAEGILEGRGDGLCRLTNVAATQAVSVGDDVFTARQSGVLPYPMVYGQVIEAELETGALFWEIVVKPAAQFELQTVQILTTRRNPQRTLAN